MNVSIKPERLRAAYATAKEDLLRERNSQGHWVGELSSSSLSTATAISALVLAEQGNGSSFQLGQSTNSSEALRSDPNYQGDLSELLIESLHWLARQQNEDGGWGDTDLSYSNIATTMLVRAAFQLTGVPAKYEDLVTKADAYIASQGGIAGLRRRYGKDKTFAAPILANYALAGLVPWKQVPALPFEMACLPQSWYRMVRMPVVSYAIPALVAIGQAKFHHHKPRNLITRSIRKASCTKSLQAIEQMQPESGGFLEAIPLTSFVVMSLASIGQAEHPITRRGVKFLLSSVRADGSWPIDTNLATWTTTLALNALQGNENSAKPSAELTDAATLDWLLDCQGAVKHPFTGAEPGGWSWTDRSGGVPDADDTSGALLTLANSYGTASEKDQQRIATAAHAGVLWLLGLQNSDGGFPTFCRGWGTLPFDRSAADITAHVLRAITAWKSHWLQAVGMPSANDLQTLIEQIDHATQRAVDYLLKSQNANGTWPALWFGNQDNENETNPVYGSSRVLLAFDALGLYETPAAEHATQWLVANQHASGGWGATPSNAATLNANSKKIAKHPPTSVEETALALEALLSSEKSSEQAEAASRRGISYLIDAVEAGKHLQPSPIGFYFANLWYYERLYPRVFSVAALGQAVRRFEATNATQTEQNCVVQNKPLAAIGS